MAGEPKKKSVHWGVQLFVVFHLLAVTCWSLPLPPDRVRNGDVEFSVKEAPNFLLDANFRYIKSSKLEYYMMCTGLWQYWDMFAPNPSNFDVWVDAIVYYENGEERVYQYPRMKALPIHTKYFKERYRKYIETAHLDRHSHKWPFLAQRIAYLNYEGEENRIVWVELRRHYKIILPPEDGSYVLPEESKADYEMSTFFIYTVDQEKLMRDAAK